MAYTRIKVVVKNDGTELYYAQLVSWLGLKVQYISLIGTVYNESRHCSTSKWQIAKEAIDKYWHYNRQAHSKKVRNTYYINHP